MLGQARIDAPDALHHIIIRGIERKAIFKDDLDRKNFLEEGDVRSIFLFTGYLRPDMLHICPAKRA